jgi:hypothetical protein
MIATLYFIDNLANLSSFKLGIIIQFYATVLESPKILSLNPFTKFGRHYF